MQFDIPTLMSVLFALGAISIVFMIRAWLTQCSTQSLLTWIFGLACLTLGFFSIGLDEIATNETARRIGEILILAAAGLTWRGCLKFDNHEADWASTFIGMLAMAAIVSIPALHHEPRLRDGFVAGAASIYLGLAALSLYRGRKEELRSRLPLAAILWLAAALACGRFLVLTIDPQPFVQIGSGAVMIAHLFAAIVSVFSFTVLAVSLASERNENRQRQIAAIDMLTGCLSRREFIDFSNRLLDKARRDDLEVGLLLIDIDDFKKVNDRLGHLAGDHVLTVFAEHARHYLRSNDLLGRIGGEEFAAIFAGLPEATLHEIGERMRSGIAGMKLRYRGAEIKLTISIGIAMLDARETEVETLISVADRALYDAKHQGRNLVVQGRLTEDRILTEMITLRA